MIHERLKVIADRMGIGTLSKKSGIGERTLRTYLSGSSPSADKLAAIIKASGDDANWVLLGEAGRQVEGATRGLVDEELFSFIFNEIHKVDDQGSPSYAMLKMNIDQAMKVYNEALSLPGKTDLRAKLILTQSEKNWLLRLINNESAQHPETPEEQEFISKKINRYETRLSDLNAEEISLIKQIGPDYNA